MTYLLIGRKGGGKSAVAMHLIVAWLRSFVDKRPIITNLDIREYKLARLVFSMGGSSANRLFVRRSPDSRTNVDWQRKFWRDRGDDVLDVKEHISPDGYKSYNVGAPPRHGCIYVIDETGDAFGNREWAKFSAECGWYMRAERHLEDDCYLMCQNETLLDVTFSKLFNEVWRIWAGWRVLVWGFKMPKKIKVNVHHNLEDVSDVCVNRKLEFKMDKRILDCYRSASLGGGKVKGDVGKQTHGLPFWMLPAGVVLLLLVFGLAIRFGAMYTVRSFYHNVLGVTLSKGVGEKGAIVSGLAKTSGLVATDAVAENTQSNQIVRRLAGPVRRQEAVQKTEIVVAVAEGAPIALGWSLVLGERTVYWVRTQYGELRVSELMCDHGQLLHLGGGRWRLGHRPEGFSVQLPDGWGREGM